MTVYVHFEFNDCATDNEFKRSVLGPGQVAHANRVSWDDIEAFIGVINMAIYLLTLSPGRPLVVLVSPDSYSCLLDAVLNRAGVYDKKVEVWQTSLRHVCWIVSDK